MSDFKNNIKDFIQVNNLNIEGENGEDYKGKFLQFIYDYTGLEFQDEDFQKRKRVKNKVPDFNRCCALKANGERCSRRVKEDSDGNQHYCGTHVKGLSYGSILNNEETAAEDKNTKVEIWIEEINGIQWYIDANMNVYDSNDIISGSKSPRVVHKLKVNSNFQYEFCD